MNFSKSYDELTFADDFMFCKIMQDEEICRSVIECLLKIKIRKLVYHQSQHSVDSVFNARGVRLDVYVEDCNKVFDIEMQTSSYRAIEKRIRYYQSQLDIDHLAKNESYEQLIDTFIIFICKNDPFSAKIPVYTVKTSIEESPNTIYNDGAHKILFNASAYEKCADSGIRAFLEFIYTNKSSSGFTEMIRDKMERAKMNEPWRVEYMMWRERLDMARDEVRKEYEEKIKLQGNKIAELEAKIKILENKNQIKAN